MNGKQITIDQSEINKMECQIEILKQKCKKVMLKNQAILLSQNLINELKSERQDPQLIQHLIKLTETANILAEDPDFKGTYFKARKRKAGSKYGS